MAEPIAGTRTQEHAVEIAAAPAAVWRALTEADELTRWFADEARVTPGLGGRQWVSWGEGGEVESAHRAWSPCERLVLGAPPPGASCDGIRSPAMTGRCRGR